MQSKKYALVKIIIGLDKVQTEVKECVSKAEAVAECTKAKRKNSYTNVFYSVARIQN